MASVNPPAPPVLKGDDPIDALLSAHGLRRTAAARRVLGSLYAHPRLVTPTRNCRSLWRATTPSRWTA